MCALILTACGASISAIDQAPVLEDPPEEFVEACLPPQVLPRRAMTQAEVETLWRRDRENLRECGVTFDALVAFYQKRDSALRGSSG